MTSDREERDTTPPQAKRSERERADPENEPSEFADDMRVNRFTPPPDPPDGKEE